MMTQWMMTQDEILEACREWLRAKAKDFGSGEGFSYHIRGRQGASVEEIYIEVFHTTPPKDPYR